MDLTLNDLQGYQKFQNSDLDAKLGALDNFSNSMFQAGNLEEAKRAQEYRAQLEVDSLASTPAAQALAGVSQAIGGQRDLEFSIGTEAYNRINKTYNDRVAPLSEPGNILRLDNNEYAYTRKNPFGTGTLLELDGQTKFLGDDQAGPDAIKALIASEKLPTIKKQDIFDSVVQKITPTFQEGETLPRASQLSRDQEYSALPIEDQRMVLRQLALNARNTDDLNGMLEAQQMLSATNKEYDAQLAMGQLGSQDQPWYDFFTTALDRGAGRVMRQIDRKAMESRFNALRDFRKDFDEEQIQALDQLAPQILDIVQNNPSSFTEDKQEQRTNLLADLTVNTPLEGVKKSVLEVYANNLGAFQENENAFIQRGKALSLVPLTGGMQQFQANQDALKKSGASWQEQAGQAAKDMASNPLDVVANATLESIISQPVSSVATALLFAAPGGQGPGAALATRLVQGTGTGMIAAVAESSYTYTQELDNARKNADGSERPLADILSDPKTMQAINDAALLRGASIGTVEGVTGWILPGSMNALDRFFASRGARAWQSVVHNATEVALQGISEGSGEALGQVSTSQDVNVGEILMEAAAGLGGPETLAMWQAPEAISEARQQRSATAQELVAKAKIDAEAQEQAILSPEATVPQGQGVYARGLIPQIEIGTPDAMGMADIEVYVEEDALEGQPAPIATTTQGLEDTNAVQIESPTGEVLRDEEAGAGQELELQGVVEEDRSEVSSQTEAQPIEGQIQEGQEVSYLTEEGEVRSGKVENLDGGSFTLDGKHQSFRPGKYFSGVLKPKNNAAHVELGDVLFDGQNFWKSVGDDKFVHGYKQKGEIIFDDADQRKLGKDVINDPRVDLYSKPDFDAAQQEYNGRENPQDSDRFTDLLRNTPQKQEPASAPTPPPPAEPVTAEGETKEPAADSPEDQAVTDIQAPPIPKKRTTLFKLRAHKDMNNLLGKAVDRWTDWMARTKVLEKTSDKIVYAKDYKVNTLFRQQAPETFDETVKALTEEDKAFRDQVEPQNWTEVPTYRDLEVFLKARIEKTQKSKSKAKTRRQIGILQDAQVSSILQALFVQDRAIAAYAGAKFGLYSPNASLITVDDVAQFRYGNVKDWGLPGSFSNIAGSYDPMARLVQLAGNASVVDVFHELYHDFLQNIAPLILTNEQYVRLQKFIEGRMAQTSFRNWLKKNYRNEAGQSFTEEEFTYFNKAGNISVAAHETFAQMMTRWHYDGRPVRGITDSDQGILKVITDFYIQTFQDIGRSPIATTTDDAHDLLQNFFVTPAPLRRAAFTPAARQDRINDEIVAEDLSLSDLSAAIGGRLPDVEIPEEQTLSAPAQIIGDRLNNTFRPNENPKQGVPFTSGGRNYVIEGEQVFEITAEGEKVARKIEDSTQDQDAFPPDQAGMPSGTQPVKDEELEQTGAPEASPKPIKRVRIPVEGGTREIILDPATGLVLSNEVKTKKTKEKKPRVYKPKKKEPPSDAQGLKLYSIQNDAQYNMGRMSRRLLGDGFTISRTLKQIAREENQFPTAPTREITRIVEERMASKVTVLDALRDIYKLRRMGPDQRARTFDPENRFQGIGNASVIYYLLAVQSRLNLITLAQDNQQDLDIDRNTAEMFLQDVTRAVAIEQREAGRAVNINKQLLTYAPDAVIERLESDLVRNNAGFKRYVRKALDFGKKYRNADLTDSQFAEAMKLEGIPSFLAPALKFYSKSEKPNIRDFEREAAISWAREPGLEGHIRAESRANIRALSMAAQGASSSWVRDFYAQQAKLAIEAERGIGIVDSINALMYNNLLFAGSTAVVNIVGSAFRLSADLLAYYGSYVAQDILDGNLAGPVRNLAAIATGLWNAAKSLPEAGTESLAIGLSGQRGTSVEAFTHATGTIASTMPLLYARPGTKYAKRDTPLSKMASTTRRIMTILLTDVGRRNATTFDAFYKVFSENTILGAELYREAWNEFQAQGGNGDRSAFIETFINERLNVKPLAFYQAQADQELRKNGDLIIANSISVLPKQHELAVLRNLIAFNLRREDRESKINPESVDNSRRFSFGVSYSNEPKGAARMLADALSSFATLGPVSELLGKISKTQVTKIGDTELRWRMSAGGAVIPGVMPFSGNVARMAEEFFNWTGVGSILQVGNNYALKAEGKIDTFFENNPDAYTKTEVAASVIKGIMGMGTMVTLMSLFGGADDDEDKHKGIIGFRARTIFGRNGKETFVPPYSFWWRTKDGNIGWLSFKEHPQLVASVGTAATVMERVRENPDASWGMMLYRIPMAMLAGLSETGAYEGIVDLAAFFKEATGENEKDEVKIKQGLMTNTAKFARSYAVPLNRFQTETMAFTMLGGRGYQLSPERGAFLPTFAANTYLEQWLPKEDSDRLAKMIGPTGDVKESSLISRFGGIIKDPPAGMSWMIEKGYVLNRTDYNRPISGLFTKQAQKEQAEAEFAQMNNGMFFVKHASEIEKKSSDYYWKWIESYSQDEKRQAEIKAFVNSETNQLKKRQNSPSYKTERDIQQADINAIVTQARSIGALQAASDYYTDNYRVKLWSQQIAIRKIQEGYKLDDLKVNRLLEQKAGR